MTDITNSNTATKIGMTQAYTGTLSAVTGKYLPDSITVTMGGSPATYTYNNLTGVLSITSVTGNVVIKATAEAKLAAPIIDLTGAILAWTTVDNATVYSIRSNGTEVATSIGMSIDLSTILTDEDAYAMTVVATASGFADSVASNSVTFTATPTPSGYEVQITFQGGSEVGYWVSTEIYDNYIIDDPYGLDEYEAQESGNKIGEILSANGTTTVITTTGKICIKSQMSSDLSGGSSSTSQNITEIDVVGNWGYSYSPVCVPYIVNGNGTITVKNIKWKYSN